MVSKGDIIYRTSDNNRITAGTHYKIDKVTNRYAYIKADDGEGYWIEHDYLDDHWIIVMNGNYTRVKTHERLTQGKIYPMILIPGQPTHRVNLQYATMYDDGDKCLVTSNDLNNADLWCETTKPPTDKVEDLSGTYERKHIGPNRSSLTTGNHYTFTKGSSYEYKTIDNHGDKWTTSRSALKNLKRWKLINQPQPEQDPMSNVEIKKTTLVDGGDVDNLKPETLIDLIRREGEALTALNDIDWMISNKSTYIEKQVDKHQKNIKQLVKLLDRK
jgi:hypothetical protein